jgi:hypothetical protein
MSNYDDGGDTMQSPRVHDGDGPGHGAREFGAQQHGFQQPMQPYGAQQMPPLGYQQQQQWVMRPRRVYPIETKPFFLTSEFGGAALAIAGIAITAAASDAFGAWRAWILITAIVGAYLISRGIAKSGTRSHADDPREHFDLPWGRNSQQGQDGR